jgi:AcrR family transcriptional regulator
VFQRARKPAEKEARREAILSAARELAREVGPIALGLNELGRRSGVSKPNIYRYFEGREHVLLALLHAELEDLAGDLEARFAPAQGARLDDADVVHTIVEAHLARPLLCQLLGMVASILEHNLSVDALVDVKRAINGSVTRIVGLVQRALPWLSSDDAAWMAQATALFVGALWPSAHPSPTAAEVLARPEFAAFRNDARRDLRRFLDVMVAGLRAQRA